MQSMRQQRVVSVDNVCVRMRESDGGFTIVELLVVISVIGLLVSLMLPAIHVARESARQTQCASNLRQFGQSMLNYSGRHNGYLCSGAMDWRHDGCVVEVGWVADAVNSGVPVGKMLCPSNTSRISQAYVDLLQWDPGNRYTCVNVQGAVGRKLPDGSTKSNPCRTIVEQGIAGGSEERRQLVESQIYNEHFNTNYTASWLVVRAGPRLGRNGMLTSSKVGCEADILSSFAAVGPMRLTHIDASAIPQAFVPLLACGAPSGDSLPAKVGDVPQGEFTTKSYTRGPVNRTTMALPVTSGTSREGEDGWWAAWARNTLQDYRGFNPVHRRVCNIVMADGSVRNVEDKNDDGFLNNGFQPSPTNGFSEGEIELPPTEFTSVYSLLDSSIP
jgi:prepilin-type N-terminal cleavage/methylation domain-containing protein/prepilin-type processing-associated H-X9-DG protein